MKIIIFTTSLKEQHPLFKQVLTLTDELQYEIAGIATLNETEVGTTFNDIPLLYLPYISKDMTDFLVLPYFQWEYKNNKNAILAMLKDIWHFPENKIISSDFLIKEFMNAKYENSLDTEIQNTLKFWKNNDISPFNQYVDTEPDTFDEVFFDNNADLPYIFFDTLSGKKLKMYFPKKFKFEYIDGKPYVKNILKEQLPNSPHLYATTKHNINNGDIIIDAGVCEGNFSLKYIDIAKKYIYLKIIPLGLTLFLTRSKI